MGPVSSIRRRFLQWREARRVEQLARAAFTRAYPTRKLMWSTPPQTSGLDRSQITMVCWDSGGIPPRRTWWRLAEGANEVAELAETEAEAHVELPLWR